MIRLGKDIINMLHSTREISFRYDLLNYDEVKIGELTGMDGSIGLSSLAQIKRRGQFQFKESELNDVDWLSDKIQPVFTLNGQHEFPLGVLMISSPTRAAGKKSVYRKVECFDTSLILLEDKFDTRYRILKGTGYTTAITQIINSAGVRKVNIPYFDAKVKTDREFEIGTSKLDAVNYLLQEINYTSIWVDEMGRFTSSPYVLPNDREIEYVYRDDKMSVIVPDASVEEIDLFNVPNKWVVVATNPETDTMAAKYSNQSATSPTSIVNRRRAIVDYREVDDIASQAILDEYVRRIAYEASNVYGKFIFETAIMPHHSYMDSIYCEHAGLGIGNKYIETSWEMDLKAGGKMRHNARRVIQI